MKYLIGICLAVLVVAVICIILFFKRKSNKMASEFPIEKTTLVLKNEVTSEDDENYDLEIPVEMFLSETFKDNNNLVEITDKKILARIDNLGFNLAQVGNAANNALQAAKSGGEILYKAIIPSGAKLTNSKSMQGAVRGFYRGADGIRGHANLVAVEVQNGTTVIANGVAAAMNVGAMVVGQYYMSQINAELGEISEGVSKIKSFQDNEFRSRVFSLMVHVKTIASFQVEILENEELRLSKIAQLDSLEQECTQLLGQANLTLAEFAKKIDIDYETYEKELGDAQNWYMYQKTLLDILYKISELRYTLYFGTVSREQCKALLPTYTDQVKTTQERLTFWHNEMTEKFGIDSEEAKRKRVGWDRAIHFIPALFDEEQNFREIEKDTVNKIKMQVKGHNEDHKQNMTDLYSEDVEVVLKDGKYYYLPTSKS